MTVYYVVYYIIQLLSLCPSRELARSLYTGYDKSLLSVGVIVQTLIQSKCSHHIIDLLNYIRNYISLVCCIFRIILLILFFRKIKINLRVAPMTEMISRDSAVCLLLVNY